MRLIIGAKKVQVKDGVSEAEKSETGMLDGDENVGSIDEDVVDGEWYQKCCER